MHPVGSLLVLLLLLLLLLGYLLLTTCALGPKEAEIARKCADDNDDDDDDDDVVVVVVAASAEEEAGGFRDIGHQSIEATGPPAFKKASQREDPAVAAAPGGVGTCAGGGGLLGSLTDSNAFISASLLLLPSPLPSMAIRILKVSKPAPGDGSCSSSLAPPTC